MDWGVSSDARCLCAAQGVQVGHHNTQHNTFTWHLAGPAGAPVRSAYVQEVVGRIAPEALLDRERELAELAAFCTDPCRDGYRWWRAPAWAGKSALLAWFVGHPPAGVDIVTFFVTARFAAQGDRQAFLDVVLEQLTQYVDQDKPPMLSPSTAEAHFLRLLKKSAERAHARCRRLVLVVDGLDEDRGVTAGPDAYSIAALLPLQPAPGLRVIVAGRPDPPIPSDVPEDHPLRDPAIVRDLITSPHATVVQIDAQRELHRLLDGDSTERDLLGFVTAAVGGLSARDLAELTSTSPFTVKRHLRAVTGRTFTARPCAWPGGDDGLVYELGHEMLLAMAVERLERAALAGYRRRLDEWADGYRGQGWPTETPEYLLQGYSRLLQDAGDRDRLMALATDPAQHQRLLDVTGGDRAALTEVAAAESLNRVDPDLPAALHLAWWRSELTARNANIPDEVPAAWATLGQPIRAEALARSIAYVHPDTSALPAVVKAVATAGHHDHAEQIAQSITRQVPQALALAALASVATARGEHDRGRALAADAERIARTITDPEQRTQTLTHLAAAIAAASDDDHAQQIAPHDAERTARSVTDPHARARALAGFAVSVASNGEHERAKELLADAENIARSISDPLRRAVQLTALARAVGSAGSHDRALALVTYADLSLRSVTDERERASVLADIVDVVANAGEHDCAARIAASVDSYDRPTFKCTLLSGIPEENTYKPGERIDHFSWNDPDALPGVARSAASTGDYDRAEQIVRP